MRVLSLVLAGAFLSTLFLVGVAEAACGDSVGKARSAYKDVSTKVAKMKRLHQARQMMSMKDMKGMDQDLKSVKSMVDEAGTLCEGKQDQESTAKARQAIELARKIDMRHVSLMKGDHDPGAGHAAKPADSHGMKMKH